LTTLAALIRFADFAGVAAFFFACLLSFATFAMLRALL